MSLPGYAADATGPLAGVRVLDLSRLVAGNVLTGLLADFGADVIKVEPPEGDTLRQWRVKDVATSWKVLARNKRSLAIDFRHAEASPVLLRLAGESQIFVESFRPGTLEAMGLAPAALHAANPGLVIVRISGWGQSGPYRHRPGFGTLVEGMSGFASMNGFGDREPLLPPMYLADSVAGLHGATAVMVALREVELRGGAGQVIDLPLLDPLFSLLGPQAANFRLTGQVKPRTGNRSTNSAPRNAYPTRDGNWVCLSASTQQMAERLFRSIGRADLIADERYATNAARVANAAELDAIIGAFIARHTQAEAVAYFDREQVTIGPIYDISQIIADPHVQARGLVVELPDADMGSIPMQNVIPGMSATPPSIRAPAPRLGADNSSVLAAAGFDPAEIERMRRAGLLRGESMPPTAREQE